MLSSGHGAASAFGGAGAAREAVDPRHGHHVNHLPELGLLRLFVLAHRLRAPIGSVVFNDALAKAPEHQKEATKRRAQGATLQ